MLGVVVSSLPRLWLGVVHRTAEEVRNFGPSEPPVKGLVQGAYSHAWVDMNLARQVGCVCCSQDCGH
jgi:hypothetical protein